VLDAYSRVLTPLAGYLVPGVFKNFNSKKSTWLWLGIMFAGTMVIIGFLVSSMRQMVDLATTLSFITTPAFAYINYKAVTDKHFPAEAQPGKFLKILAWIGMGFFVVFSIIYIVWRYIV
jgi:Mn2+/Fe2+ NRAMP family transporter